MRHGQQLEGSGMVEREKLATALLARLTAIATAPAVILPPIEALLRRARLLGG